MLKVTDCEGLSSNPRGNILFSLLQLASCVVALSKSLVVILLHHYNKI